ncbi:hypothetical protein F5Y19DRAFT_480466 [Xylariaceae sp. FL1651]|nr:hypothetical protein F5Y19DRAFT_480466 [Xylariaceae sp. FL1651]
MLQRCRITGTPVDRGDPRGGSVRSISRPLSECEWKPFELIQKRSGPHNLSRSGYDEEKCRNVLVRFCAHVPRNFQYKDGIQQIFLILREHLGDENLDLAGGVLYELIEVDCEHTDDPGAAFQRWRHDHMYRYADLELPHIPHMTTITSSIIPTERLSRWRSEHSERYRFVLSDSSPLVLRTPIDPSCIRNKKAWLIDHTLFVSTRSEGTRHMRSPNPQEFHEMQWSPDYGGKGRLVEERELPILSLDRPSETSPPRAVDISLNHKSRSQRLRHSLSSISIIEKIVDKLNRHKKEPEADQRRRSWIPGSFILDAGSLFRDKPANYGTVCVPFPDGCQIPNAIFARKFLLISNGENLPSHLPISQMPTAESKATETIIEAATTGLLNQAPPWLFRGPFTPQLGFDGGLDYQWIPQGTSMNFRRFDLEALLPETPKFDLNCSLKEVRLLKPENQITSQQSSSKRRGRVFDLDSTADVKSYVSKCPSPGETSPCAIRENRLPKHLPISPPYTPDKSTKTAGTGQGTIKEHELRRRDAHLFENIEFAVQVEPPNSCTPVTNRKTTVIERPKVGNSILDHPRILGNATRVCNNIRVPQVQSSLKGPQTSTSNAGGHNGTHKTHRELLLSNIQQEAHGFRAEGPSLRRVSHGVTGEILQPLRYNASGGWKSGVGQ